MAQVSRQIRSRNKKLKSFRKEALVDRVQAVQMEPKNRP